jgi:hypothetical protein
MRVNGWILFAGIMMIVIGTMNAINGLIALFEDEVIINTGTRVVAIDVTAWGWIHLLLGIVIVIAAFSLLNGAVWARLLAAFLAALSIFAQIAYIDAYPFWSLAIIGICVAVIYAVCTMGRTDEEVDLPMSM